jgi:hypothetical protein
VGAARLEGFPNRRPLAWKPGLCVCVCAVRTPTCSPVLRRVSARWGEPTPLQVSTCPYGGGHAFVR